MLFFSTFLGCGGPETVDEPPRNVPPAEEEPIGQLGQGGTARLLLPEEPSCLNPYRMTCNGSEAFTGAVLEAPLVVGPSVEHRPLLAEAIPSYEAGTLSLAPLTVEFRLREDISFSDGEPLTSADVEWTYEQATRLAREGEIAPLFSGFSRVSRVETPDRRTVRLVFDEPYAYWRDLLTAPVLPRHLYEDRDLGGLTLNDDPVGSGPFLLQDKAEGKVNLVESAEYWVEEPPLPNLSRMEVRFPEAREAADNLAAGQGDFGFFAAGPVPSSGDLLRAAAAPVRVEYLLYNSRRVEERSVRDAIGRAVDREEIAETIGAPVARSFVPPEFVPGYTPAWETGDAETVDEPFSGTLDLVYAEDAEDPARERVVSGLLGDLSSAGIEVEARAVSAEELFGEVLLEGSFDLALLTGGTPAEYGMLVPSLPPAAGEKLAGSLESLDEEERAGSLVEAQEVSEQEAALLPLFVWPDVLAWSSDLVGPRPETPYRGLMWNARDWAFYK